MPTIPTFDLNWNIGVGGDFDGDGHPDLAWLRPFDNLVEIQLLNGITTSGGGAINNNPFSAGWNIAVAGDFNGDGKSDFVWQRQSDGLVEIQLLNGNNAIGGGTIANNPFDNSWTIVAKGDFNGDGKADLAWESQTT